MQHTVVSQEQWLTVRKALLAKEKEFTKARDTLRAARRELPWVKVEKNYVFEGPAGKETPADLFTGKSQLMIYHFMLGPGWVQGCPNCSYLAEHFDGANIHLVRRDGSFVEVSRAPLAVIGSHEKRMGWRFKWVSFYGSDFNFDFRVSFTPEDEASGNVEYNYIKGRFPCEEAPGLSAFIKDRRAGFHTYSTYGRSLDVIVGTYNMLDLAPKVHDEKPLPWSMAWVKHHNEYEAALQPSCCRAKS